MKAGGEDGFDRFGYSVVKAGGKDGFDPFSYSVVKAGGGNGFDPFGYSVVKAGGENGFDPFGYSVVKAGGEVVLTAWAHFTQSHWLKCSTPSALSLLRWSPAGLCKAEEVAEPGRI